MKVSISGVRGIFGGDLNLRHVLEFSRAFARIINSGACVLARDTRASGGVMGDVASAALMERGIDVHSLGIAPTPFAFREARKVGAGLIVTASHNPLEWNGLKFLLEGRGIFEDELRNLKDLLHADGLEAVRIGKESTVGSSYVEDVLGLVGQIGGRPRVAVDPTGGAACQHARTILERSGCDVTSINDVHGKSSRTPDPTTDDLKDLRNTVSNSKCDAGFAYDLDGDRLVVVDGRGSKMDPDATLLLCVSRAIEMGAREIVISVDTSDAVGELAKASNCRVTYSKVGEANVTRLMMERKVTAGGEGSSGGFVMGSFNLCRDGLLASAMIAGMLRSKKYDECMEVASRYHLLRQKVAAETVFHAAVMDEIAEHMEGECSSVDHTDGAKGIFDEGTWVLVRGSNTEEIMRISVQSKSKEKTESLCRRYELKIREAYEKAKREADY